MKRDYKKRNNGDDSKSKNLVVQLFKWLGQDVELTKNPKHYLDGIIHMAKGNVGLEIKDRSDKFFSRDFDDVICEQHKLDEFKKDNTVQKMYVINIYADNIIWIGDIEVHTPFVKMANRTTEFSDRRLVQKHLLSIKRKWGFKFKKSDDSYGVLPKFAKFEFTRIGGN